MATHSSQIPCHKIVSGGQTGVDRGALDACLQLSFWCGGWCPKNRMAEDGKIPERYPLIETNSKGYHLRTKQNVLQSDGTLIISPEKLQGGTLLTRRFTDQFNKPLLCVTQISDLKNIISWLIEKKIQILNIAGPRLSEWSEGYNTSFQITSGIVNEIKKTAFHKDAK